MGRFREAMTAQFERLSLARELGDKRRELLAINGVGTVFAGIGQLHLAIQYFRRACDLAEETGNTTNAIAPRCSLADCAAQLHEPLLGLRALASVESWVPRTRVEFLLAALARNTLARLNLLNGEIDKARFHALEDERLALLTKEEKSSRRTKRYSADRISSGEVERGLAAVERSLAYARRVSKRDS